MWRTVLLVAAIIALDFVVLSVGWLTADEVNLIALGRARRALASNPSQETLQAFDAILLVILASVLSRAINGSAAFFATLGGGVVLVVLHRVFAHLAYHSHRFGILVKGSPDTIVRDGKCDLCVMRRNHVSIHDLDEDMRLLGHTDDISQVRLARVERSGEISFIKKDE